MLNILLGILFFLIAITIIVVVHEWGHLVVAKRNGVKCFEFSIGMGPKIFTFHTDSDGTVYNLRAIPLGGYVMMAGEQEAENMEFDKEQSLSNKTPWQKIKILFAGAIMNFILGWFVLFIAYFGFGVTVANDTNAVDVIANSPAEQAGLTSGDQIVAVDGVATTSYQQITQELSGKSEVEVTYVRDGTEENALITPKQLNCDSQIIGIKATTSEERFNLSSSFKATNITFLGIAGSIKESLNMLFSGTAGVSDLMGPVGIASASKSVVNKGFKIMLITIAFLSINIGFVNILPFPALDGGRIVLAFIELVTRKKVPEKFEMFLNLIGFILLMGLFVIVTFADVGRIGTAEYYTMAIDSDAVCARDEEEINYTFSFTQISDQLPSSLTVELKVSDGTISGIKTPSGFVSAQEASDRIEYKVEDISQFAELTVQVKPDPNASKPLDLTVKLYDEKNDVINQAIYRIER